MIRLLAQLTLPPIYLPYPTDRFHHTGPRRLSGDTAGTEIKCSRQGGCFAYQQ
jgi:hypothetical protein